MTSSDGETSWISWFCSLKGSEFFCQIDEDYIHDKFNLTGLTEQVPHFKQAIDVILDLEPDPMEDTTSQCEVIEQAAEMLYGLIHARYVLTPKGLQQMLRKYQNGDFGLCPRFYCDSSPVLPIGLSDIPNESTVKLFCPKCEDIYNARPSRQNHIDGAFFGTSYAQLMFMSFPEGRPKKSTEKFTPRLFGFKLHPLAYEQQIKEAEASRDKLKTKGNIPYMANQK